MVVALPAVQTSGQQKPQIAPPSKSDSFGTDENGKKFRVQHREIAGTNFQVAGVDLAARAEVLEQAARTLGRVETKATGDAADFLEEACYRPMEENDRTRLIFQRGEVSPSFVLSSEPTGWKWKTPCKRSPKITRGLATASGLHLGQTQEQVIAILGLPTTHHRNTQIGRDDLAYELQSKRWMTSRELAPLLKDELKKHPKLDQSLWIRNYGFYSLWVSIDAKFINDKLSNLRILWSETY